jgi:hypothetical protein
MVSQEPSSRKKSVTQVSDFPFLPLSKHLNNIIIRKYTNKLLLRDNQDKVFPDRRALVYQPEWNNANSFHPTENTMKKSSNIKSPKETLKVHSNREVSGRCISAGEMKRDKESYTGVNGHRDKTLI